MTDKQFIEWLINRLLLDEATCEKCCYYGTTEGEMCREHRIGKKVIRFAKAPLMCKQGIRLYATQEYNAQRANKRVGSAGGAASNATAEDKKDEER